MEGTTSRAASISGEDSAEFEIIQQSGQDYDDEENYDELPASVFPIRSTMTTATQSQVSSVASSSSYSVQSAAPDVGEAFGAGKSMSASSMFAYQSQSLLDSMFAHSPQMEKLVTLLYEEQNKDRAMLERIMQTAADLSKERDDNTELRTQNQALKAALQQEHDKFSESAAAIEQLKLQLSERENELIEVSQALTDRENDLTVALEIAHQHVNELSTTREALSQSKRDLAEAQDVTPHLENSLDEVRQELFKLRNEHLQQNRELTEARNLMSQRDDELDAVRRALSQRDGELASHVEIVNVLQEERSQLERLLETNRAAYRRNLDALEAQMAGAHERGEFPIQRWNLATDYDNLVELAAAPHPTVNIRNSDVTVVVNRSDHRSSFATFCRNILAFLLQYLKYSAEIIFYLSLPLFLYFIVAICSSNYNDYSKNKYRNQRKYDYI